MILFTISHTHKYTYIYMFIFFSMQKLIIIVFKCQCLLTLTHTVTVSGGINNLSHYSFYYFLCYVLISVFICLSKFWTHKTYWLKHMALSPTSLSFSFMYSTILFLFVEFCIISSQLYVSLLISSQQCLKHCFKNTLYLYVFYICIHFILQFYTFYLFLKLSKYII